MSSLIDIALAAQIVIWLAVVGWFLASGQFSIFHPASLYLVFHLVVFVVRPILVHYFGFDAELKYMMLHLSEGLFLQTLVVSSAGLVVFVGASVLVGKSKQFCKSPAREFSFAEERGLLLATLLLSPLLIYSLYMARDRIPVEMINGISVITSGTGYVYEFQNILAPLMCAWLVKTRFHWANLILMGLFFGYRTWYGWSRWTMIMFLMMVVLIWCWKRQRKFPPAWSFAALVPFLVLFNAIGEDRDVLRNYLEGKPSESRRSRPGTTPAMAFKEKVDGPDFANFDFLAYVVSAVPDRTETYSFGAQYLQLFTEPIPRMLWKSKPVGAPVKTISIGNYGNFVGRTVTLPGDGWISGGWVGLVVTMGLVGSLLGRFHKWFWDNATNPVAALCYLVNLPLFLLWFRDGGISIAKFVLWSAIPLAVWVGLAWLLGERSVPSQFVLPAGTRLRVLHPTVQPGCPPKTAPNL